MTSPMITAPISAGVFLFGDDNVVELANRLTESDVLKEAHDGLAAVGDGVWAGAHKELASMASDFLDLDLASVAVAGWCKHRELVDVAERLDGTSASAVVPLWTLGFGVQADHVRGEGAERDPGRDGRRGRVRFL